MDYSEWSALVVYVKKKNSKIRVCVDYSTRLNDSFKILNYLLPSPENIFANLNGGKFFSKIDLSDAYFQIEVDASCKKSLTINTHKGFYKFDRLPFGVKVVPNIFHQIMDAMLTGQDLDDILMKSKNRKEHAELIEKVFERIKDFGFKVSDTKCEFFMTSIKYFEQIIDANGRKPDNKMCFA